MSSEWFSNIDFSMGLIRTSHGEAQAGVSQPRPANAHNPLHKDVA